MPLPTEPIGSIPRPEDLQEALRKHQAGRLSDEELQLHVDQAVQDTLIRFEATGSPVITDGEQGKPSFATYPLQGLDNLAPEGATIEFEDGHTRTLPRLVEGPFAYGTFAVEYLERAQELTELPLKQAVIAPSALGLIYPDEGIEGYPREAFLADLIDQAEEDVRRCLEAGAAVVQLDFTEGRLAAKLDPSGDLLKEFVAINNRVLDRFTDAQRARIGIHTCPGGDRDATHSGDVDYAELLPDLFELHASRFYMQLASEDDPDRVLDIVAEHSTDDQTIFVGVIDPIDPGIESPDLVRERILRAAEHLPVERLGTTDDCGFSPFGDDTSTSRDRAFAKIAARVEGTQMASAELGV